MTVDFVTAVLARIESDVADLPTAGAAGWRGRVADEAALLFALLRDDPRDTALDALLTGMLERGVPPLPVRCFVRVAAAAAFTELWHRAGPGDATVLLRTSRLIEARRRAAERLLHHDPELPPAPAPRTMEVV